MESALAFVVVAGAIWFLPSLLRFIFGMVFIAWEFLADWLEGKRRRDPYV